MKILVAEDDSGFALILRRTLEKIGHTVTVTSDGLQAWEALQRQSFPLVISDWMMPEMDGPTLCRRIRERVDLPYTYVIMLTSRSDRLVGLYSGADDFLEKPLGRGELFARLAIAERILLMQDHLQRRALETAQLNSRLQRQNDELEHFATMACHDLQEPLRKIQMFSSRLTDNYSNALGHRGAGYIARIESAATRMQALIKDMFALTQIDQVDRVLVPVDITEIVKEVVADLEARLVETGGRVEIGADLPIVPGDPAQIRQLLQNLIGNALKFHRKDVVPVVKVTAPYSAWARIDVADNGVGFDEQYLSEIFTPFHRLHGRGEFEGSGIGLAICKKIVEWHGGTITARSSPECGATFEVDFPIISTLKR